MGTRWLRLEESWLAILETSEEAGDTEWSDAWLLSIFLLVNGDVVTQIVNSWLVLHVESERLCLKSGMIDQHSSISLKTGEGSHNMVINPLDLSDGAWVLQGRHWFLLDCKDDAVLTLQTDSCTATIDGLKSVLDLEDFAVWREDRDSLVVLGHY